MSATQVKATPRSRRLRRLCVRLIGLIAVATCIGWGLSRSSTLLQQRDQPAGFGRGILHGALMPLALPNLLFGSDVTIYAANNTGRTYKLGYTLGVNACGLLFFGVLFWRLSRWRKQSVGN